MQKEPRSGDRALSNIFVTKGPWRGGSGGAWEPGKNRGKFSEGAVRNPDPTPSPCQESLLPGPNTCSDPIPMPQKSDSSTGPDPTPVPCHRHPLFSFGAISSGVAPPCQTPVGYPCFPPATCSRRGCCYHTLPMHEITVPLPRNSGPIPTVRIPCRALPGKPPLLQMRGILCL